ncbi:hypothetical protein Hdeb2414_s0003g00115131 [Helianthus debilis subsp. tardiflorus]
MLKVSPWEGVERLGSVASLTGVMMDHSIVWVESERLSEERLIVSFQELKIDDMLQFVEEPIEIMDREVKVRKHSRIPIVRVRWNSRRGPEFTWEREDQMKLKYPQLFPDDKSKSGTPGEFQDEISLQVGDDVAPEENPHQS